MFFESSVIASEIQVYNIFGAVLSGQRSRLIHPVSWFHLSFRGHWSYWFRPANRGKPQLNQCLTIFNRPPTQNTCLFIDSSAAGVCVLWLSWVSSPKGLSISLLAVALCRSFTLLTVACSLAAAKGPGASRIDQNRHRDCDECGERQRVVSACHAVAWSVHA